MEKEDENAIRKVIDNYITGTFTADIVLLKACFHPKAVMNGYLEDDLLLGGPEPFFQDLGSKPSMESGSIPYHGIIIDLQMHDRIATVIVKEDGFPGGMSFINYFHLVKEEKKWEITSKTFTTL